VAKNDEHSELRQRLQELSALAGRPERLLSDGRPLPAFLLYRMAVDVDKAAARLARHAQRLAGEGGGA
jgi:hypothetical protein